MSLVTQPEDSQYYPGNSCHHFDTTFPYHYQINHEQTPVRGFTLIELLVVIAVIALLMAVLLPLGTEGRPQRVVDVELAPPL